MVKMSNELQKVFAKPALRTGSTCTGVHSFDV